MSDDPNSPPSESLQGVPAPVGPAMVYNPAGADSPLQTNPAGIIGLILSLTGLICLITFPIGLVVSLVALRRQPRGFAVGGSILGGVGTLLLLALCLIYGSMIVGWFSLFTPRTPQLETQMTLADAAFVLQGEYGVNGQPPDTATAEMLIVQWLDAWGNTLQYEPGENGAFVLRSAGPDRTYNTPDDITHGETYGQGAATGMPAGAGTPAGAGASNGENAAVDGSD